MDCRSTRKLFSAYLDNNLSVQNLKQFQKHLEACRNCSGELKELIKYQKAMKALKIIPAPDNLLNKINQKIEKNKTRFSLTRLFPWRIKWPLQLAGALALCLFLFLLIPDIYKTPKDKELIFTKAEKKIMLPPAQPVQSQAFKKIAQAEVLTEEQQAEPVQPVQLVLLVNRAYQEVETARDDLDNIPAEKKETDRSATATEYYSGERAEGSSDVLQKSRAKSKQTEKTVLKDKKILNGNIQTPFTLTNTMYTIIKNAGGQILQKNYNKKNNELDNLIVEIPQLKYQQFLTDLNQLGQMKNSIDQLNLDEKASNQKQIRNQIQFQYNK